MIKNRVHGFIHGLQVLCEKKNRQSRSGGFGQISTKRIEQKEGIVGTKCGGCDKDLKRNSNNVRKLPEGGSRSTFPHLHDQITKRKITKATDGMYESV